VWIYTHVQKPKRGEGEGEGEGEEHTGVAHHRISTGEKPYPSQ
jgi:hypothetical protein